MTYGVSVRPCGGSLQVEVKHRRKTKIVARTSGHPGRCRWATGERASNRDAHDSLVMLTNSLFFCLKIAGTEMVYTVIVLNE